MQNKQPIWYRLTNVFMRQYGEGRNPIKRFTTDCCALGQLSLNNDHTIDEIKEIVEIVKKETELKWQTFNREGGERALFVITTMPHELTLADNLAELGFLPSAKFNRRNGYPEGFNMLWVISW